MLVAVVAAAATWRLSAKCDLTPASRRAWTIAALFLGLPVPFGLLLLTSRSS